MTRDEADRKILKVFNNVKGSSVPHFVGPVDPPAQDIASLTPTVTVLSQKDYDALIESLERDADASSIVEFFRSDAQKGDGQ